MEMELNSLIEKIKKEGVEKADSQAQKIIADANTSAQKIIIDAQKEKEKIIKDAQAQAKNFQDTAEKAIKQSARDALLTLRSRVTEFFGRVVKARVSESLDTDILKQLIIKAADNLHKEGVGDIEVVLSKTDKEALQKVLFASLAKDAKERVKMVSGEHVEKGFRVGEEGKNSYLDFTDQAIASGFRRYLNPKLVEILDIDLGISENSKNNNGK